MCWPHTPFPSPPRPNAASVGRAPGHGSFLARSRLKSLLTPDLAAVCIYVATEVKLPLGTGRAPSLKGYQYFLLIKIQGPAYQFQKDRILVAKLRMKAWMLFFFLRPGC